MTFDQVARLETKLIADVADESWATINAWPVETRLQFFREMSVCAEMEYRLDRIEQLAPAFERVLTGERWRRFLIDGEKWVLRLPPLENAAAFGVSWIEAAGEAVDRGVAFDDDAALAEIARRHGLFEQDVLLFGPEEGGLQ